MVKTKSLKQEVMFKAGAHEVYEVLLDSKKHAKFTGEPAKISRKVDGRFTAYGDYISGTNMELVEDKKIVQSWRASSWPTGCFSTVTFLLKPAKAGTKLVFSHTGVPAAEFKSITTGWKEYYWEPMKKLLEK